MFFTAMNNDHFKEEFIEYVFYPGFALSQKQKNVESLFTSIHQKYPNANILEVSTKSLEPLGAELSAFNLKYKGIPVESIFQSSKVFVKDSTQYSFLINYSPREAKKYVKEHSLGQLKCFRYENKEYPLFPESAFYDFIYIQALKQNEELSKQLLKYDVFTDIEFNPNKSINCQARACSIFVYLSRTNKLDVSLSSFEEFIKVYDSTLLV